MKKLRMRLDGSVEVVYALVVDEVAHGPYPSASAARKAASKANVRGEVLRVSFNPTVESVGTYDGEKH